MALGGGTYLVQNKVLPGCYINFISAARATATLSDRGYAAMPLELNWGPAGAVFTVTNEEFQKDSRKIFGYEYTHDALKGLRDLFLNAQILYAYRLNGGGEKASGTFATAKYPGTRGNDLKVIIQENVDDSAKYDVSLYLDNSRLETQTVATAAELVDNDYVVWKKDATLAATAGEGLKGGTNSSVDGAAHQAFLDKVEGYPFNILGVVTDDDKIKSLYINFTKRMRDEVGAKFQLVLQGKAADYEGVINVKNEVADEGVPKSSLVYWTTGVEAACAVNRSVLNRVYDGEYEPVIDFTQAQLEAAIRAGEFSFHKVGQFIRVLNDTNSLVTLTDSKGEIFQDNQTIRVIDQIANDIATLFTEKYLGVIPNDASGRISLWADIVKHHEELAKIRAIEDFSEDDITVDQGDSKKSVVVGDKITVVNAMTQLYMAVKVA
ncbi:MAG: phage tail sheath family protein [Eisenbergiella massiliensis]|uniref:phage tail sheath family protein n=1 Tax=Eisenbergiella massiliensis TaxID=1720294 RepID=UPI003992A172